MNKETNKQKTESIISTNATSVQGDHISDKEQVHSGRIVSFELLIAVVHWR